MKVELKYFASTREAIGHGSEIWQTHVQTVGELRNELLARGTPYTQALARGQSIRTALNQTLCAEDAILSEGCEVAFFPPVTGG